MTLRPVGGGPRNIRRCIKAIKPVGVGGKPAVYCLKPVVPGTSYCEDHQPK